MSRTFLRLGYLLMLASFFVVPSVAFAASSISSPTAACFQGGTPITLNWTLDPSADHAYAAIWQGSAQPTFQTDPNNNLPDGSQSHNATAPIVWNTPNVTTLIPYQLYVEAHGPSENVIDTVMSNSFNLDANPPNAPVLTPGGVGDTVINLAWNAPTDNGCEGVRGYKLYRDGTLISTQSTQTYQDTNLKPNTSYAYKLVAYDNFASSPDSNVVTLMTKAVPAAPKDSTPTTTTTPQQEAPAPTTPEEVKPVSTTPTKLDTIDDSKAKPATTPERIKNYVTGTSDKKKSDTMFYVGLAGVFIIGGGAFAVFISRGHQGP